MSSYTFYKSLVIKILRTLDQGFSYHEIIDRVERFGGSSGSYVHKHNVRRVLAILEDLDAKGQVNSISSMLGTIYRLKTYPVFPGSKALFSAYIDYMKSINGQLVLELLKSAYEVPKPGENEGLEPDLEEIKFTLEHEINVLSGWDYDKAEQAKKEIKIWFERMQIPAVKGDILQKADLENSSMKKLNSESPESSVPEEVQIISDKSSFSTDTIYRLDIHIRVPRDYPTQIFVPEHCIFITEPEEDPQSLDIQIPYYAPGHQPQFLTYRVPAPPQSKEGLDISLYLKFYGHIGADNDLQPQKNPIVLADHKIDQLNCLVPIDNN